MPSTTRRQDRLKRIRRWMLLVIHTRPDDEFILLIYLYSLYKRTATAQYLARIRHNSQRRTRSMYEDALRMLTLPEADFYNKFCVTQETFIRILKLIENNPIFFQKPTGCPRAPPEVQLAATLWRMTHEGNGASVSVIARTFGCAEGSTVNFTDRVQSALMPLETRYTYWPTQAERDKMEGDFAEEGIPGGCVGAIDGCHVVLYARPGTADHKDFFNRKDRYSYNIQAVADLNKRIRHLHVGHPGCSHDMQVFAASQIGDNPEALFAPHQFIIANGGYQALPNVVPVFREDQILVNDQHRFNKRISHTRVQVKHSFGILKGRFSSLRGLWVGHIKKEDQLRAAVWIRCCLLLDNLILEEDLEPDDAQWLRDGTETVNNDDENTQN